MRPFKVPRQLPPEFRALPLDLLRDQNWPSWPEKLARGMMAYPSGNARPLPASAGADPISNAKDAVAHIMGVAHQLHAWQHGMRPVGDTPVGKAVKNAQYTGMEDVTYVRSNPPQQSIPWIDHKGIWPQRDAVAEFMSRLVYPGVPAGIVADWLKQYDKRRVR